MVYTNLRQIIKSKKDSELISPRPKKALHGLVNSHLEIKYLGKRQKYLKFKTLTVIINLYFH
jgi:hypothetical protein